MYIYIFIYIFIHIYNKNIHIYKYISIYIYVYTHTHIQVQVFTRLTRELICTYTNLCTTVVRRLITCQLPSTDTTAPM